MSGQSLPLYLHLPPARLTMGTSPEFFGFLEHPSLPSSSKSSTAAALVVFGSRILLAGMVAYLDAQQRIRTEERIAVCWSETPAYEADATVSHQREEVITRLWDGIVSLKAFDIDFVERTKRRQEEDAHVGGSFKRTWSAVGNSFADKTDMKTISVENEILTKTKDNREGCFRDRTKTRQSTLVKGERVTAM